MRNHPKVETVKQHACCGGSVRFLRHHSEVLGLPAEFGIFLPKEALEGQTVPVIYALAGLTCNQETFLIKSNAIRFAAEHGIALVAPDTSPRGAGVEGEEASYDLGTGAGFYLNATQKPWSQHYRMAAYIGEELPSVTEKLFPLDAKRRGIIGHSMGGMGALIQGLSHPNRWKTVSALAPICQPSAVDWGRKAFTAYLGEDQSNWRAYDPCLLLEDGHKHSSTILVDQGLQDEFLGALRPDALEHAAKAAGQALQVRRHDAYDHSYWFIQSVIEAHMAHHARGLLG
ncbi:esterase [Neokomagataea thailandica NBRC 106555]|uniref:S-formylglutathione hydrolase n=2 Tax=Neokomagataea TaxID=1223423 RepID=A0A4Y6V2S5_9PROT|nr:MULTISPECIES: S-formylglutathione hydrolase [Neokomagataea]QDH24283.1 S-formylglutathione hydrolase [Neokomagataea tanensis]GBR53029.1 esterase [Neokomagataea thailandica NBRC 106555]